MMKEWCDIIIHTLAYFTYLPTISVQCNEYIHAVCDCDCDDDYDCEWIAKNWVWNSRRIWEIMYNIYCKYIQNEWILASAFTCTAKTNHFYLFWFSAITIPISYGWFGSQQRADGERQGDSRMVSTLISIHSSYITNLSPRTQKHSIIPNK